ncbi:restriction endonuclease subunit S [Kosakonia sp. H7A]|uniref:restriction endonuclease subunit S n=1 Tax=Kosakonia sp. H7A TaxID=2054598 RepID=UPI000D15176B|nr:restriction endonuclease subunit S [Kosakonia sp. H7A]PTA90250.1 restriction endonuclease subunit S [Kosakonia sp. H7A]
MSAGKLPEGWAETQLGNVVEYGKVAKRTLSDVKQETWVLELEDIEKDSSKLLGKTRAHQRPFKSTKNSFQKGDVLYGKLRPYLNKIIVADEDGVCTTEIVPINAEPFCFNKYIFYWLKSSSFLHYVDEVSYGVNMPRLGTADGLKAPLRLAPLAEQKIIAEKLDTLLAQVDSTKARLEQIPKILKRFRQAVLDTAVNGKLTEDIRPSFEPWLKLPVKSVFKCIDGDRGPNYPKKNDYKENGDCLFLSTKNVRPFGFNFAETVFISKEKDSSLKNGKLEVDDLIITTRGTLGNIASYDKTVPFANVRINSGMLILRKINREHCNDFLKIAIASPYFQREILRKKSGSAQPQLPANILKEFLIPIPSVAEQHEIVRRVEQLFAYADTIEKQVNAALARVNNLTQSILAKAFRGELTAQWRAENPDLISGENSAAALLEKIKAERAASTGKKASRKKA